VALEANQIEWIQQYVLVFRCLTTFFYAADMRVRSFRM